MTEISHRQAEQWMFEIRNSQLPPEKQARLEAHLAGCAQCRTLASVIELAGESLSQALQRRWEPFRPSQGLARSVLEKSRRQTVYRNTKLFAGSILAAVLLLAAVAVAITSFRPRTINVAGNPVPSDTAPIQTTEPVSPTQTLPPSPAPTETSLAAIPEASQTPEPSAAPTGAPGIPATPYTPSAPRKGHSGLIAYVTTQNARSEIYVMNPDGTDKRKLVDSGSLEWAPVWSPDGKRLAFISLRTGVQEIFTINADGSGLVQLTHNTFPVIEIESGTYPKGPAYPYWEPPSWSPDGEYLVTILHAWPDPVQNPEGGTIDQGTLLARIASDGSGVAYIQKGSFESPQWSPDGTLLATICWDGDANMGTDICILDPIHLQPDGNAPVTNVTNTPAWGENSYGTMWSPDGSSLVYFASINPMARTFGEELRIIERNGWKQRTLYTFKLIRSGASGGQIAWSPDGSQLALIFATPSSLELNHIYLIDPKDSQLTDLGQADWDPINIQWSLDGKFLLYEAGAVVYEQDSSGKATINRDERAVWIMDVEAALNKMAPPFKLTQEKGLIYGGLAWQPVP